MAVPHAEQLIERAEKGEKLSTSNRRMVLAYLMQVKPSSQISNVKLASLFQITERQIRVDRQKIRKQRADILKQDDIGLVISDIVTVFERQMHNLEKGLSKLEEKQQVGSLLYKQYCESILSTQLKVVEALQNLGYYPKNLGTLSVEKYEFTATVNRDDSQPVRPINLQIKDHTEDAEFSMMLQKEEVVNEKA